MFEQLNFWAVLGAALIPTVVGFLYYNPKTVGTAWMNASGMTEEKIKGGNMLVIFGASILLSFFLAVAVMFMVIHQTDLFSIFTDKPGFGVEGTEVTNAINEVMRLGGSNYRTFGHGAFHGVFVGLTVVLPIIVTNNLYERKPFKLSLINTIYWTITIALMGGVLCQWAFPV